MRWSSKLMGVVGLARKMNYWVLARKKKKKKKKKEKRKEKKRDFKIRKSEKSRKLPPCGCRGKGEANWWWRWWWEGRRRKKKERNEKKEQKVKKKEKKRKKPNRGQKGLSQCLATQLLVINCLMVVWLLFFLWGHWIFGCFLLFFALPHSLHNASGPGCVLLIQDPLFPCL